MNCKETRKQMSEYIDGVLDEERKQVLMEHVGACANCRRELSELERTIVLIRNLEEVDPPADLLQQVHARLSERKVLKFRIWNIFAMRQVQVAAAAALVLGVCIYGFIEIRSPQPQPTTVAPAKMEAARSVPLAYSKKAESSPASPQVVAVEGGAALKESASVDKTQAERDVVQAPPAPRAAPVGGGTVYGEHSFAKALEGKSSAEDETFRRVDKPVEKEAKLKEAEKMDSRADDAVAKKSPGAAGGAMRGTGETYPAESKDVVLAARQRSAPAVDVATFAEAPTEEQVVSSAAAPGKPAAVATEGWADGAGKGAADRSGPGRAVLQAGAKTLQSQSYVLTLASADRTAVAKIVEQFTIREKEEKKTAARQTVTEEKAKIAANAQADMVEGVAAQVLAEDAQAAPAFIVRVFKSKYTDFVAKLRQIGKLTSEVVPAAAKTEAESLAKPPGLHAVEHADAEEVVTVHIYLTAP